MSGSTPMPKYRCHKEVWALKIKSVSCKETAQNCESDGGMILSFEDEGFAPFEVSREYVFKHKPVAGGYYVVYKDGYESFSPAKAFEDGYTRI